MFNGAENNVGIAIPTIRSDFVIRQIEYYAKINSAHPVYIGDACEEEDSKKLQTAIEKIGKRLIIHYYRHPKSEYSLMDSEIDLYNNIKEKYCVFSGDDDYQIPASLTKCAEFLENNPDYSSTSGHAVSFRLTNNGVYGELKRLADYPRRQIESSVAAERLISLMADFRVNLFSVHRTEGMRKCWSQANILKDWAFSGEILPCARSAVLGKSKVIDCLSFVRQIHDKHAIVPDTFDWITGKDWHSSYEAFDDILAKEIVAKDAISIEKAHEVVKQSLWSYINMYLPKDYIGRFGTMNNKKSDVSFFKKIKTNIGNRLPLLKDIYHKTVGHGKKAPQLHYEVLRPNSKYYPDFKPIMNSFAEKNNQEV